jgi:hypothetical protein
MNRASNAGSLSGYDAAKEDYAIVNDREVVKVISLV